MMRIVFFSHRHNHQNQEMDEHDEGIKKTKHFYQLHINSMIESVRLSYQNESIVEKSTVSVVLNIKTAKNMLDEIKTENPARNFH